MTVPLPTRDGVGPSCIVLPQQAPAPCTSIAAFLIARFPGVSPAEWAARIAAGEVADEHGVAVTEQRSYQGGLRVYYYRQLPSEPRIPFEENVLFQDELIVVADKPHFLPVTPGGKYLQETLLVRLKRKLGIDTLAPVHRIDRETAGLVVFTIQPDTRGRYQSIFLQRTARKYYEAIAPLRSDLQLPLTYRSRLIEDADQFMQMREEHGEQNSETHIKLIETIGQLGRYRLSPITGRKHQLRAHCAALGIPILNDLIYPKLQPEGSDDYARPLQLLARELAFDDPVTGEPRRFVSARSLNFWNCETPLSGAA